MTHELECLDLLPQYRVTLRNYIEYGIRPDGFLFAVLTNDLFGTRFYADRINRGWDEIDDYINFLTRHAPPNCFGSRAKVEAWIEDAAERRAMANAKEASHDDTA